jgi:hypothetical protein
MAKEGSAVDVVTPVGKATLPDFQKGRSSSFYTSILGGLIIQI